MAGPNDKHRQGGHKPPPSVIGTAPAAAPEVEPVRSAPVAVASPAPLAAEPAQADVEPPSAKPEATGSIDIAPIAEALHTLAAVKAEAPALPAPQPAALPSYVAVCPIFIGGQRGRIEPGEPFKPANDAERDLLLAQRVIRAS